MPPTLYSQGSLEYHYKFGNSSSATINIHDAFRVLDPWYTCNSRYPCIRLSGQAGVLSDLIGHFLCCETIVLRLIRAIDKNP